MACLAPFLARARNGAWHVGDAVMDDVVNDVGWFGMSCGPGSLEASALIDGNIHQYGTLAHNGQVLTGDQLGRCCSRDQHATYYQVG